MKSTTSSRLTRNKEVSCKKDMRIKAKNYSRKATVFLLINNKLIFYINKNVLKIVLLGGCSRLVPENYRRA